MLHVPSVEKLFGGHFFGHLQAIEKLAAVVLGVPEINDCENDENDQKSDKNSHLISPSPSVRSRQSLSFCNVIFVQFVSDFSCLFFGQLNNRTASFQPCGCSGMSVPNHPALASHSYKIARQTRGLPSHFPFPSAPDLRPISISAS